MSVRPTRRHSQGRRLASILRQAWRTEPPVLACTEQEIEEVVPCLIRTGAGGLAWWRVRGSGLRETRAGHALGVTFARQGLGAQVYERSVLEAVSLVERAGIDAIVLKGVAAAAAYPARGVRVTGDIDLLVAPRRVDDARRALETRSYGQYKLDFEHMETEEIPGMGYDAVMERSRRIEVAGVPIRVLGWEDNYRHLCLHFLGHYGFRPLWLCDIAAASEALPATFDWEACLTADERVASWVRAATALARDLLGAEPATLPASLEPAPTWLRADILRCWGAGYVKGRQAERSPDVPIRSYLTATALRQPWTLASALRERWRSRLEFMVDTRRAVERRPPIVPRVRAGLRRASEAIGGAKGGGE